MGSVLKLLAETQSSWTVASGRIHELPYSGKLSREKTFANWWKYDFCRENFRRLLAFALPKDTTPQISRKKLSRIATKLRNSRKFSPSKVFRYTVLHCMHEPMLICLYCNNYRSSRHWITWKKSDSLNLTTGTNGQVAGSLLTMQYAVVISCAFQQVSNLIAGPSRLYQVQDFTHSFSLQLSCSHLSIHGRTPMKLG